MKQNQVVAGHLLIIFTQVVLGLNILVTLDILLNYLSPFAYIGIRAAVTALFFWIVQIFAKKQKIERKDFMLILLGGFLGFVFSQYLTSLSLKYTTPVYFSLILALSPVVILILQSIFFNEKITKRKMLGIAFGIFGAAILAVRAAMETGAQGSNNLLGILFAVVSVSSFAGYVVICADISRKYHAVTQMKWIFSLSAFLVCPYWVLSGTYLTEPILASPAIGRGITEIAFLIIFATIAVYILIPIGMRTVSAAVVSIYMNLQPIVASITAILIGMDVFTWDKPIALVFVLLGAYIVTSDKNKDKGKAIEIKKSSN